MSLFQVTKKQVIENYELRTMTGDIVSFTPSYSQLLPDPFSDLNVTVNVVATGGNGTPDNPNPINGYTEANITRCGVNLFDEETELGILNSDGTVSPSTTRLVTKNFIPIVGGKTYAFVFNTSLGRGRAAWYDANKTIIEYIGDFPTTTAIEDRYSLETAPANACYFKWCFTTAYGTTYRNDTSICYPTSETYYRHYTGNTYTVNFGQTVYGGVLDVTRGKLTVTHILKNISDISWTYRTISGVTGYIFLSNDITVIKAGQSPTMASCYAIKTNRNYIDGDGQVAISNNTTALDIVVKDDTYTSADDFVQNRGNERFVFELATPFDIDLTPEVISAVVGTNNVFGDCGNVTVTCLI